MLYCEQKNILNILQWGVLCILQFYAYNQYPEPSEDGFEIR